MATDRPPMCDRLQQDCSNEGIVIEMRILRSVLEKEEAVCLKRRLARFGLQLNGPFGTRLRPARGGDGAVESDGPPDPDPDLDTDKAAGSMDTIPLSESTRCSMQGIMLNLGPCPVARRVPNHPIWTAYCPYMTPTDL